MRGYGIKSSFEARPPSLPFEDTSFMDGPLPNKLVNLIAKSEPSTIVPHLIIHDVETNTNHATGSVRNIHRGLVLEIFHF